MSWGEAKGEVEGVAGEGEAGEDVGGAEAAVVGFAAGDDVFDVDVFAPVEGLAGVGAVEGAAGLGYDLGFEALGVAVVVGVVGGAAVFGLDGDAGEPVAGRGGGFEGGEALGEVVLGGEEAVDAGGEVFEGEGALGVEAGGGEEEGEGQRGQGCEGCDAFHGFSLGVGWLVGVVLVAGEGRWGSY